MGQRTMAVKNDDETSFSSTSQNDIMHQDQRLDEYSGTNVDEEGREEGKEMAGTCHGSDGDEGQSDGDIEANATTPQKKRKKKKKKKKTSIEGDVSSSSTEQKSVDAGERKAAQKKFKDEILLLSKNDEDTLWAKLSGLYIDDTKVEQLCSALRKNTNVISLDVSNNLLTDIGVGKLCKALKDGAAPDLIELKLYKNPGLDSKSLELEDLQAVRRYVRIETTDPDSRKPLKVDIADDNDQEYKQNIPETYGTSRNSSTAQDRNLVSQYFQMGENQDTENYSSSPNQSAKNQEYDSEAFEQNIEPEELSRFLWNEVFEALDAECPIPARISEPLRAIADAVGAEMDSCMLPMLEDTQIEDFKPFTYDAISRLRDLRRLCDLPTESNVTQFSKEKPVKRAGSHRIALAELLAQLMRAECPVMVASIEESNLVPFLVALSLARPSCSTLHTATLKVLQHGVSSSTGHTKIWKCLFDKEYNSRMVDIGREYDVDYIESSCLVEEILHIILSSKDLAVGMRPLNAGFAIAVADLIYSSCMGKSLGQENSEIESECCLGQNKNLNTIKEEDSDELDQRYDLPNGVASELDLEDRNDGEGIKNSEKDYGDGTTGNVVDSSVTGHSHTVDQTALSAWQLELKELFQSLSNFDSTCHEDGPLDQLLISQNQELGGPRPVREPSFCQLDSGLSSFFNGGMMMGDGNGVVSGSELLALLQNFRLRESG